VKLTTHLHVVPMSTMRGAIPPHPTTPSVCGVQFKKTQEQLYFTLSKVLHGNAVHLMSTEISYSWYKS